MSHDAAEPACAAGDVSAGWTAMRDACARSGPSCAPCRAAWLLARRHRGDRGPRRAGGRRGQLPGRRLPVDPAKVSLTGVYLGQAVVAILAAAGDQRRVRQRHDPHHPTAMPRRTTVLAAKAAISRARCWPRDRRRPRSVLAGRLILPGHGFTAAHGYPALSLGDGPVLRAAAGSVLYLALIALLSLGVATAVRDSAAAIGVVLGLLYLVPIIAAVLGSPSWHRHLQQIAPMTPGWPSRPPPACAACPSARGRAWACWPPGPPRRCSPAACCSGSAMREPGPAWAAPSRERARRRNRQ